MPTHIVPAAVIASRPTEGSRIAGPSSNERRTSYGAVHYAESPVDSRGKRSAVWDQDEESGEASSPERPEPYLAICPEYVEEELEPDLDVTWKYMSRLYMMVPVVTLLALTGLILIITFAWPPNRREEKHGQRYPHDFLWRPLLIGIFASCTVQVLRVPIWVIVEWFNLNPGFTTYSSTILHSILHELIRLSTLPITVPSPTSGFHSSYYLGLGWGIAEATWGIIQGYEQLSLYEDVFKPEETSLPTFKLENHLALDIGSEDGLTLPDDALSEREDEADLERKVEILERMRGRRDLEEVIGVSFPSIPFALHILWRIDTLLLNLGLTLILSAFYYDPIPIYRHPVQHDSPHGNHPALGPHGTPSPYLWLVWALVAAVHVAVSVVWKVVGRVGIGAVTWGGLIVALGSVFAGLGSWGGLV